MKYTWLRIAILLILGFVIGLRLAESCGPFLPEVQFASLHRALPGEFTGGHLGVVRPGYFRLYLLLAYRVFSEAPLSGIQDKTVPVKSVDSHGRRRAPMRFSWEERNFFDASHEEWLEARKAVPGVRPIDSMQLDRQVSTLPNPAGAAPGGEYEFYGNCLGDAFRTAVATLRQRIAERGVRSPQVAEWVRAQDQVFDNCAGGTEIPGELADADARSAADRRYQIAAAKFYAGQFDQAIAAFDSIAFDAGSPWHGIAPYLAARACIRQGTLFDQTYKLQEAAERLRKIIGDPSRQALHNSAQGLLEFVRARLEPQQRLVELGQELTQTNSEQRIRRVLTDYTRIWDRLEEAHQPLPEDTSDVAAWIATFQKSSAAVDKWRARKTTPWLVAALAESNPPPAELSDLIRAAKTVGPDFPAYASVTYYGILRQMLAGQRDAARQWADAALKARLPDSALNLIRAERCNLARNWTEFLRNAGRKPVAESTDGDGSDMPFEDAEVRKKAVAFDGDAEQSLNQVVPLDLWSDAASSALLPRSLQADIARAGWVRAIILNDAARSRALADRVRKLEPELESEMSGYLTEPDAGAARFDAVFLMLRAPGLSPVIRAGLGRTTAVLKRDILRDNWWSLGQPQGHPETALHDLSALSDMYPDGHFVPPEFLPKDRRDAGEKEWEQLVGRAGNAVNYLCSEAIAWARQHSQDDRIPQALYLAVEATHYGPADKNSSAYSKLAFDLLHRRYPNSEWTKKTKYWY